MGTQRIFYCPGCERPLAKKTKKGKYYCENERCHVIFIKRPYNPDIVEIFYKSSIEKKTKMNIEKTPIKILYL